MAKEHLILLGQGPSGFAQPLHSNSTALLKLSSKSGWDEVALDLRVHVPVIWIQLQSCREDLLNSDFVQSRTRAAPQLYLHLDIEVTLCRPTRLNTAKHQMRRASDAGLKLVPSSLSHTPQCRHFISFREITPKLGVNQGEQTKTTLNSGLFSWDPRQ